MAGEKRLKNKKLTIRLTEEMKDDWDAYLAFNNLKGQEVIEEYIAYILYNNGNIDIYFNRNSYKKKNNSNILIY